MADWTPYFSAPIFPGALDALNKSVNDSVQFDPIINAAQAPQSIGLGGVAPVAMMPARVGSGPFAVDTTPLAGKTLYHETSPANAAGHLVEDLTNNVSGGRTSRMFLADNPDIAIGQGGQGVRLEFNGNLVSGFEHRKPGTGDVAGREYQANALANNAIQRITVAPGERLELRPAWQRKLEDTFHRADLPDGTTIYARRR